MIDDLWAQMVWRGPIQRCVRLPRATVFGGVLLGTACNQVERLPVTDEACIPESVQAAFDRSCALSGCHASTSPAEGLVLAASGSPGILSAQSMQRPLPLVTLGDTKQSYLAHKLMPDPIEPIEGAIMPVGFDPSNVEQTADVATILAWIGGAASGDCGMGTDATGASGETSDSTSTGPDGTTEGTSGGETPAGIPCDVDAVLQQYCRSCHADPPTSGAPMSLVSYEDLSAASPFADGASVADRSLLRMRDDGAPMPPAPGARVPAADADVFAAWVEAGAPAEVCDDGQAETGETGDPTDPFDVDPICSSDMFWNEGDDGDPRMHPGRDCVGCHDDERADDPDDDDIPDLVIGGTIYPTAHEPDDCYGDDDADLRVIVESMASQVQVELSPGSTGNILLHRSDAPSDFDPPYLVKIVRGDAERIMPIPAEHGSCNECHTQDGAQGAPGRAVTPD